jgi:hypothetical protein
MHEGCPGVESVRWSSIGHGGLGARPNHTVHSLEKTVTMQRARCG